MYTFHNYLNRLFLWFNLQKNTVAPDLAQDARKVPPFYGEATKAIRVPESIIAELKMLLHTRKKQVQQMPDLFSTLLFPANHPTSIKLPLFTGKVAAGFPSPADDYVEKTLDLNDLLIQKPAATFFVRAEGESMLGAGIHPNDILVVDRSIEPVPRENCNLCIKW